MGINRTTLVLSASFVEYANSVYDWAMQCTDEFTSLPVKRRRRIRSISHGANYKQRAVNLVNVAFADVLAENDLDAITWQDLERAYCIYNRLLPNDLLGLIYHWFNTQINLYVPGLIVKAHKPFESEANEGEVKSSLFHEFFSWLDRQDRLGCINPNPHQPIYVDELYAVFVSTIDTLTHANQYYQRLFDSLSVVTHENTTTTKDVRILNGLFFNPLQ